MRRPVRRAFVMLLVWTLPLTAVGGCSDGPAVQSTDLETFRALLDGGLTYQKDPFVRAESLRVVEILGASRFEDLAQQRLEDDHPMVRVAALRALLAMDAPKAEARAVRLFNDATTSTKRGVLQAILEYSPAKAQEEMLERAIEAKQPADIRRYAFREGLVPRVEATLKKKGNDSFVRELFLPKVNTFLTELDTELGGPVLELMLRLDEKQRARPVIEEFADRDNSVERRLEAARILIDAGAQPAKPTFQNLLERADAETIEGRLALPDEQMDRRLIRAAILGLVAAGDETYVAEAKSYMKDASHQEYIEVLEALSHNPTDSARLALENALRDARPTVRDAAIDLYARREDADVDVLLAVHQNKRFKKGTRTTRHLIARHIGERFSYAWVATLRNQLASEEGIMPALTLLKHVYGATGDTRPLEMVKKDLVRIAESDQQEAVPLAAYLLVQLPPKQRDTEIDQLVASIEAPLTRYAYLENLVRHSPGEKTGLLLENFYAEKGAPELFSIRLMSGAGLWTAEHGGDSG